MKYLNGEEIQVGDKARFGRSHFSATGWIKEVAEDYVMFYCTEDGCLENYSLQKVTYNGFEKIEGC